MGNAKWDSIKTLSYTGTDDSFSWYHDLGAPVAGYSGRGKNAVLIISLGMMDSLGEQGIGTVTVDGASAVNVLSGIYANAWLGYYLLPQSGYFIPQITVTADPAIGNPKGFFGSSLLCYGVDQTTPIINATVVNGSGATASTSLTTTGVDELSYFKLIHNSQTGGSSSANTLPGRFKKELYPFNQPGDAAQLTVFGNHAMLGSGSGGTRTASWTLFPAARTWTIHKCEIKAAAGIHTTEL